MCEFCSYGPNSSHDGDQNDLRFAGFFSSEAIDAAVRQATEGTSNTNNNNGLPEEVGDGKEEEDDDDDGT